MEWWQKIPIYRKHRRVRWLFDRVAVILDDIGGKRVANLSASLTYYSILALFPFVIAVVAVGSMFINENNITRASDIFVRVLPNDIANLLIVQLHNALGQTSNNSVIAIVAIIISVISISGVVGSLITALSVIYGHQEKHSFLVRRAIRLVIALSFVVGALVVISLLLVGHNIYDTLGLSDRTRSLFSVMRWVVLAILISTWFGLVYRYGRKMQRQKMRRHFFGAGTLIPSALWVIVSLSFFWYLSNVTSLTRSYSLFAGIIGMMLWFHVTYFVMLVGACIDKEIKS